MQVAEPLERGLAEDIENDLVSLDSHGISLVLLIFVILYMMVRRTTS
jgi:hypothetical protein